MMAVNHQNMQKWSHKLHIVITINGLKTRKHPWSPHLTSDVNTHRSACITIVQKQKCE